MTTAGVRSPAPETIRFGTLEIGFDARVLRPRPWTTAQSEWAAEILATAPPGPVLELCAGAGQIGLLAAERTGRHLVCVDIDPVACGWARHNAAAAGLGDRVEVREGPMDEVLEEGERFAVVIADPPWVPRAEIGRFPEDPRRAIDGGEDGTDLAKACLEVAWQHLLPGGSVLLQVGTTEQVERLPARASEVRSYERGVLARVDFV